LTLTLESAKKVSKRRYIFPENGILYGDSKSVEILGRVTVILKTVAGKAQEVEVARIGNIEMGD